MLSLGYHEYVVQGGDWGSLVGQFQELFTMSTELKSPCIGSSQITRHMAVRYGPKHVKAWHTNYPVYVLVCALPSILLSNSLGSFAPVSNTGYGRPPFSLTQ